jgi:antibiotic biosynthesis monooxygenase (ABM) superfamily enzyme
MQQIVRRFCLSLLFPLSLSAAGEPVPVPEPSADPETVLVTYRVLPGKEAAFRQVIKKHWQTLRQLKLVTKAPHTLVRGQDHARQTYFVELFTWINASVPDHAPAEVRAIWNELNQLCRSVPGHEAIEIAQVEPVEADG